MKTLKTYKSRSTGIILALLLLFARTNNTSVVTAFRDTLSGSIAAPLATTGRTGNISLLPIADSTTAADTANTAVAVANNATATQPAAAVKPTFTYSVEAIMDSTDISEETAATTDAETVTAPVAIMADYNINNSDDQANAVAAPLSQLQIFALGQIGGQQNDNNNVSNEDYDVVANGRSKTETHNSKVGTAFFTATLMYDTLVASSNKDFLFNNITINNITNRRLSIIVKLNMPKGWQLVTPAVTTLNIEPYSNNVIPVRLLPAATNSAKGEQVVVEYYNNINAETTEDAFTVKVKEFTKFRATLNLPNYVMSEYQKHISFPVHIKNSGNTASTFNVQASSRFFMMDDNMKVTLPGGVDTTIYIKVNMTEGQWNILKKEDVKVIVGNGEEAMNLHQSISKIGSTLKDHASAYLNMPLQVEAGTIYQGGSSTQYYGALYGTVDIDENNKVAVAMRSNTIAKGQDMNNHIVRVDYFGKNWEASAGNIMEITEFLMDGYGGKLGYNWGEKNQAQVYGMLKSRTGDNKVMGGNYNYEVKKDKLFIRNAFTTNIDNVNKLNSYILRQSADVKLGDKGQVSVTAGLGMEENSSETRKVSNQTLLGTSLGYDLQWASKHVSILSNVLMNSNNYAGIYKGQRTQLHEARYNISRHVSAGAFYENSFRKQTFFFDTGLVTNLFNLSMENYGVRGSWSGRGKTLTLSVGNQKQQQGGEGIRPKSTYDYVSLNTSIALTKDLFFMLNASAGQGKIIGRPQPKIFSSSTMGTIQYRYGGISFRYDQGPYYYHEILAYVHKQQDYRRVIISPYAEGTFFKKSLTTRVQYNFASHRPGQVQNANLMANVVYNNIPKGYDLAVTGMLPLTPKEAKSYVNASFRMRINTPFVAVRKYHTVKVVLFKDQNGNGQKDNNEQPIAGQMISLNGTLFISDMDGVVSFKNIDKGTVKLNMGYNSKVKGWAPTDGLKQSYAVEGNQTIEIPYKMSRVLEGKLNLVTDELSNLDFSLSNIKIVVTDEKNNNYSTLTDPNGEFYFNLPEGNYLVTISDAAFDEYFRPTQMSQQVDMRNNNFRNIVFEIRQKKREINIRKKS